MGLVTAYEGFIPLGRNAAREVGVSDEVGWYLANELLNSVEERFWTSNISSGFSFSSEEERLKANKMRRTHSSAARNLVFISALRLQAAHKCVKEDLPMSFESDIKGGIIRYKICASEIDAMYRVELTKPPVVFPAAETFSEIAENFEDIVNAIWHGMKGTDLWMLTPKEHEVLSLYQTSIEGLFAPEYDIPLIEPN